MATCDRCGSSTDRIRCVIDVLDVRPGAPLGVRLRTYYALCDVCEGNLMDWMGEGAR